MSMSKTASSLDDDSAEYQSSNNTTSHAVVVEANASTPPPPGEGNFSNHHHNNSSNYSEGTGVRYGGTTAFHQEQQQLRSASATAAAQQQHHQPQHQYDPESPVVVGMNSNPNTTGATSQAPLFPEVHSPTEGGGGGGGHYYQNVNAYDQQQYQQSPQQGLYPYQQHHFSNNNSSGGSQGNIVTVGAPPAQNAAAAAATPEDLEKLRIRCKKNLIAQGLLSLSLFFVFWSCFVVPLIVGVLGLVVSIIGVTHFCTHRDLHHNNCCCGPVSARRHIVGLQLALVIADAFGILISLAGVAAATHYTGTERTYRMAGSVICLLISLVLLVVCIRGYCLCKKLRLLAPAPQVAALPLHTVMSHHSYTYAQTPTGPQYYAQHPQQQSPIVVGTVVG